MKRFETTVVNLRYEHCDVKICRSYKGEVPDAPQPGCFGNPFVLSDVDDDDERAEVIQKYREYFLEKVNNDYRFRAAVMSLKGKRLGCFCKPKPCHGDVIVEWLDRGDCYEVA